MNRIGKIAVFSGCLVIGSVVGLGFFVRSIDADAYRPQLAEKLGEKIGRTVRLDGPIAFSFNLRGFRISIEDVALANPSGASRPFWARIGKFQTGVAFAPLLRKQLLIKDIVVENADILMETTAEGQKNWELAPSSSVVATTPGAGGSSASSRKTALSVDLMKIKNSQIAVLGADGKRTGLNISSLTLQMHGKGAQIVFAGDVNGTPATLDMKTNIVDLLAVDAVSLDAIAMVDGVNFSGKGLVDLRAARAEFPSYELSSGKTILTGQLTATWGEARPTVRGTLNSTRFDLNDFKKEKTLSKKPVTPETSSSSRERMFSADPLPLDALRSADVRMAVSIEQMLLGKGALDRVQGTVALSSGNLVFSPLAARIGPSPVSIKGGLDASGAQARFTLAISAADVDLGELQKISGMASYLKGQAGADIRLSGEGNSLADIASSLGGVVTVTAREGRISSKILSQVSSLLGAVFALQGGDSALNCLAVRFLVRNGIMMDNGILLDSASATVLGKGYINLGDETMQMSVHARTKGVNVGSVVPPLMISGGFQSLNYSINDKSLVKGVIGTLIGLPSSGDSASTKAFFVPVLQTPPKGQNACVYTLDHPQTEASSPLLPADPIGQTGQKIKDMGKSFLKGLFNQ